MLRVIVVMSRARFLLVLYRLGVLIVGGFGFVLGLIGRFGICFNFLFLLLLSLFLGLLLLDGDGELGGEVLRSLVAFLRGVGLLLLQSHRLAQELQVLCLDAAALPGEVAHKLGHHGRIALRGGKVDRRLYGSIL